jgi:hypothetical protein
MLKAQEAHLRYRDTLQSIKRQKTPRTLSGARR